MLCEIGWQSNHQKHWNTYQLRFCDTHALVGMHGQPWSTWARALWQAGGAVRQGAFPLPRLTLRWFGWLGLRCTYVCTTSDLIYIGLSHDGAASVARARGMRAASPLPPPPP
jgi:hypothetical protein